MDAKDYWQNIAGRNYAHLEPVRGRGLEEGSDVLKLYKEQFLDKIDWENKLVIDYGAGGAFLGRYLIEKRYIESYVDIDIAQRSLDTAKETLKEYSEQCGFYLTPVKFSDWNADIFICLACIQHFPSKEYLDDFLNNVNSSGVKDIILQIRFNEETVFNNAYDDDGNVGLACRTNAEYIYAYLTNYKLEYKSEVMEGSNYQYLIYRKK